MNQENGKTGTEPAPVEMYRVRRIEDGFYLYQGFTCVRNSICVHFHKTMAHEWPREQAAHIACAMIALTGDHGIEIEPV